MNSRIKPMLSLKVNNCLRVILNPIKVSAYIIVINTMAWFKFHTIVLKILPSSTSPSPSTKNEFIFKRSYHLSFPIDNNWLCCTMF